MPEADSIESKLITADGFPFRPRIYHLPELKKALNDYYGVWRQSLSESEHGAFSFWYGRGFKELNAHLRQSGGEVNTTQEQKEIVGSLVRAIKSAPPPPLALKEAFRGESHEHLTLEEAQQRCRMQYTASLSKSFLSASIYENEAFNFARDYHASGFTEGGLMIPLGALQKPIDQQIIYRYVLPNDRTGLAAAWVGQTIGEMLFLPDTKGRWLHAERVAYVPADDLEESLRGRMSNVELSANADYRLFVTIELMPNFKR